MNILRKLRNCMGFAPCHNCRHKDDIINNLSESCSLQRKRLFDLRFELDDKTMLLELLCDKDSAETLISLVNENEVLKDKIKLLEKEI